MFTKAIVKRPCKNMVKGITTAGLGRPDYNLALDQHDNYIEALEACGLSVTILEADEEFPDSTFIEDTCLVTPACAVITRPGAETRRGEISAVAEAVKNIGVPVESIQDPSTLDAGDIMMTGNQYYVGLSDRTNPAGTDQLGIILEKYGLGVVPVPLSSMLHLKTGLSFLEHNNLLAVGEFLTRQEFRNFNLMAVDEDEAYAANSVWINERVMVPAGFPKTREMIEKKGYETLGVDVSEFRKLDGGLSCLSLRF
ncbi:dimethylarginine dimethylaminohydrolase family protein [Desulfospira joergensenii]|uniref:dimethylarginine dimethylaminohydrolase family protein n=1 Tax=Desulfospira joergensenii TaxID=53329 RepID=UPI0003B4B32E|nr:N(G),N(G)-dimethylarginine dimethylaminohydrolase [Desulfospira joergensenii]